MLRLTTVKIETCEKCHVLLAIGGNNRKVVFVVFSSTWAKPHWCPQTPQEVGPRAFFSLGSTKWPINSVAHALIRSWDMDINIIRVCVSHLFRNSTQPNLQYCNVKIVGHMTDDVEMPAPVGWVESRICLSPISVKEFLSGTKSYMVYYIHCSKYTKFHMHIHIYYIKWKYTGSHLAACFHENYWWSPLAIHQNYAQIENYL